MSHIKKYLAFLKGNLVFVAITVVIVLMFGGTLLLPKILALKAKVPVLNKLGGGASATTLPNAST